MSGRCRKKNFENYDGYDDVMSSGTPTCDVCGRASENCAAFDLRGRGIFRICPHCLISSDSEEVSFVRSFGKLIKR